MPWEMDSDRTIFVQIIERIEMDIVAGKYKPGDKLPTVRELAVEAAVNPNTMQKAYTELERTGLVYSQRTNGRFVTDDAKKIENVKRELAGHEAQKYLAKMKELGFDREEAIKML